GLDDPADVAGVLLPQRVHDLGADLVQLTPELLDLLRAQVRDRARVHRHRGVDDLGGTTGDAGIGGAGGRGALEGRSHAVSWVWIVQVPATAEMQVCTFTGGSSGVVVVRSPLRRSRTAPSVIGRTQPKQMPIRQPLGIRTPASSAASRIVVPPSSSRSFVSEPTRREAVPPSPASITVGRKRSMWSISVRPAAS